MVSKGWRAVNRAKQQRLADELDDLRKELAAAKEEVLRADEGPDLEAAEEAVARLRDAICDVLRQMPGMIR